MGRNGGRSGEYDLFLLGVDTGEVAHVTPHDEQRRLLPGRLASGFVRLPLGP